MTLELDSLKSKVLKRQVVDSSLSQVREVLFQFFCCDLSDGKLYCLWMESRGIRVLDIPVFALMFLMERP